MCVFKPHRFSPLADDLQLLLADTVSGLVASGLTSLSQFAQYELGHPFQGRYLSLVQWATYAAWSSLAEHKHNVA